MSTIPTKRRSSCDEIEKINPVKRDTRKMARDAMDIAYKNSTNISKIVAEAMNQHRMKID